MSGHLTTALWTPRAGAFVLGVFAAVALSLALIGLYGVLSYGIAIRRRELAVRLALGAAERQILGMLVKETRGSCFPPWSSASPRPHSSVDSRRACCSTFPRSTCTTFLLVPLIFLVTAFVAAYRPARRAARVDPTIALRQT